VDVAADTDDVDAAGDVDAAADEEEATDDDAEVVGVDEAEFVEPLHPAATRASTDAAAVSAIRAGRWLE
jgi:hypothetical protein